MKTKLFILFLLAACVCAVAAETENPLEVWSEYYQRSSGGAPSPVAVTATLKMRDGQHFLAFRLTNISKDSVRTYPSMLPWGSPHSIKLAGVTTDGKRLTNLYPISDPPPEEPITLAPGETREGEYQLARGLEMGEAPKDRDIIVLWLYRWSGKTDVEYRGCTGALVIPKAK